MPTPTATTRSPRRSQPSCDPRFATPRTPSRDSLGPQVAAVARALGQPLLPWQQYVADVATELGTDGLPCFREIVVSVPRQAGKTTFVLVTELQRCIGWATAQRVAYTAQTGQDARKKLLDDQIPIIERSALRPAVAKINRAQGNEGVLFKNGSRIDVLASTESAGHGKTLDLGVLDEVFADVDDRREQAVLPAMITRPAAQLLVVSTMGTDESVYLNRKVDIGRTFAETGRTDGIAYFEWSADLSVGDPSDPTTWAACHPGLGHTIRLQEFHHAHETMSPGEFQRAMLNVKSAADERALPAAAWDAVNSDAAAVDSPACFAIEVTPSRAGATIAAVSADGVAEIVDQGPGATWAVGRVVPLARRFDVPVVLDVGGPAAGLKTDLEAEGVRVVALATREVVNASSAFFDAVIEQRVQLRRDMALDAAASAVSKRKVGDSFVWSRQSLDIDTTPVMAVSLGLFYATQKVAEPELWAMWA